MELKDFISNTLKQIVDGISDSKGYAKDKKAFVVPNNAEAEFDMTHREIYSVKFDIAITTTDNTKSETGVGIFVAAVGLGGKTGSSSGNQAISRIQFEVPIKYPG